MTTYMPHLGIRRIDALEFARKGDWWDYGTCEGAWAAKGAASLADSYTDLSGNGNDLALGVAPTWASGTGWAFNGSTQYLDTGIVPGGTGWSVVVSYSGAVSSTNAACGVFDNGVADRVLAVWPIYNGRTDYTVYINDGKGRNSTSAGSASGVIGLSALALYIDGSPAASGIWFDTGTSISINLYVGAINKDGAASDFFLGNIQAIAVYSNQLSAQDMSDIYDGIPKV